MDIVTAEHSLAIELLYLSFCPRYFCSINNLRYLGGGLLFHSWSLNIEISALSMPEETITPGMHQINSRTEVNCIGFNCDSIVNTT